MGYYIQGPVIGKAAYLIDEHGAREVTGVQSLLKAQVALGKKAVICVMLNGAFDAAAFVYSERELDDFFAKGDHRPKRWLVMDLELAKKLSGFN